MAGFALAGAITPGPVNLLALRYGSQGRRTAALAYVAGASGCYAAMLWGLGRGAERALAHLPAAPTLQWLCAAYLLWLAWRIARAPVGQAAARAGSPLPGPWRAFIEGAALQALNPKAWLVGLSGLGLFVLSSGGAALAWFSAISLLACLFSVGCWALAGTALQRWLRSARRERLLNAALAALLAASVGGMLLRP
ncbi:MAG: LysE family translocator [Acidovorax sp.]